MHQYTIHLIIIQFSDQSHYFFNEGSIGESHVTVLSFTAHIAWRSCYELINVEVEAGRGAVSKELHVLGAARPMMAFLVFLSGLSRMM